MSQNLRYQEESRLVLRFCHVFIKKFRPSGIFDKISVLERGEGGKMISRFFFANLICEKLHSPGGKREQ